MTRRNEVSAVAGAARQLKGARETQEDSFGFLDAGSLSRQGEEMGLLVLADGMGGHLGGAVASHLAVQAVLEAYPETTGVVTDRLRAALDFASDSIADELDAKPELAGMGCTLVVAAISGDGLEWVSVGDSPLWLCRGGRLRRLNADHSMAPVLSQLVKAGELSAEQARTDLRRHSLRSALTGEEPDLVDLSSQPVEIEQDDIVVLATDGIETLDQSELAREVSQASVHGLDATAEAILARVEAVAKPNQDNTTLLLFSTSPLCGGQALPRVSGNEATVQLDTRAGSSTAAARTKWRVRTGAILATLALLAAVAWVVLYEGPLDWAVFGGQGGSSAAPATDGAPNAP